ncbi:MAG: hypothetical protein KA138_10935 [Saprospiraceae bacterium]|nr:hypothetical protein [Saprospiraceae bacterium]
MIKIKSAFALLAVILLSVTACKKDPIDPTIPVSQPQQPNPLPANALLKQIKWADNDHYTFTYDAQNRPLQLRYQYQFVQGDPTQIRTIVYDFQYDAQQRLSQINQTGGWVTRYFYHGNLIHNVKDFYPGGALANETVFIYANNRIVQENYFVSNPLGEPPSVYKRVLGYDDIGNLNKVETYEQEENLAFKLLQTNVYSDFDNKVNPKSWLLRYPYLPQVRWQFNNPGKETIKVGQDQPKTILFTNEYDAQGLPISNTEIRSNGILTAQFFY